MENCSKCGAPMAISKTKGTPYCSKLCWKGGGDNQAYTPKPSKDEKIKEMFDTKTDNIKWLNSLNNSTLLVANGKLDIKDLMSFAMKLYKSQPVDSDTITLDEAPF